MNPDQLSAKHTESGEQKALFAWAAMAQYRGFNAANDMSAYTINGFPDLQHGVKELAWLHSIPNGGLRDARTAALMKAEGARKGIADIFLPVSIQATDGIHGVYGIVCGLYIEMKTELGLQSSEQKDFEQFVKAQGYAYHVCRSWRAAAIVIQNYLT